MFFDLLYELKVDRILNIIIKFNILKFLNFVIELNVVSKLLCMNGGFVELSFCNFFLLLLIEIFCYF